MGSRFPSHQLSNGLFVSGRPEHPKEKPPPMTSTAVPYTGGDIKKSGELGKMFDIPVLDHSKSIKPGPVSSSHSGPMTAPLKKSNSGPLNKHGEAIKNGPNSPLSRQHSGPLLPATGLITSGPLGSSALPRKVSGPLDPAGPTKAPRLSAVHNRAVTTLTREHGTDRHSVTEKIPKPILWLMVLVFGMGFVAGGFILGAVHNALLLLVVAVIFVIVVTLFAWNSCSGEKGVVGFLTRYPDSELRTAQNGQFVKISGVVTCGNVPLESSFRKVPRCVYTATGLYEYRGWGSKPVNSSHHLFTWGLRSLERRAADFYISDFQSGLRALVKTGNGARVTPHVDDCFVMDVTPENSDRSPDFIHWLESRNLSMDRRTLLRLKEGYIKEGSTMSVMGVVERRDNILMIVPPAEGLSTGFQWTRCLLPYPLDGIILRAEDTSINDAIPV